ncbi:hypothetical protein C0J52_17985 [Blattella germanica]|nr:hypothetical protein C0J52_17985 [Blattella germanica]
MRMICQSDIKLLLNCNSVISVVLLFVFEDNCIYIVFLNYLFLPIKMSEIDSIAFSGRYTRDVREYDIIIPIRVSYTGEFMTHMIPHHYKRSYYQDKTEMGPDDKVHYLVPIKGVNHHVELWPNHNLLAPGMVIETRGSGDKKDTKEKPFQKFMKHLHIRRGRDVQCHYKGRIKGDNDSTIALSTCYGLVPFKILNYSLIGVNNVLSRHIAGSLRTKQGQFFIEPLVDHDPYSGKEHPHMIYKGGTDKLDGTCGNRGEFIVTYAEAL